MKFAEWKRELEQIVEGCYGCPLEDVPGGYRALELAPRHYRVMSPEEFFDEHVASAERQHMTMEEVRREI